MFKYLPKQWNFAKSGHTGRRERSRKYRWRSVVFVDGEGVVRLLLRRRNVLTVNPKARRVAGTESGKPSCSKLGRLTCVFKNKLGRLTCVFKNKVGRLTCVLKIS